MRYDDDRPTDRPEQDPVDLTPLWPNRDAPDRWASLVARIETADAPELARRAGRLHARSERGPGPQLALRR